MPPFFYSQLGRRESQIMDTVYRLEEAGAETIRRELPDPPSNSAVRSMLRLLEEKGYLDHRQEGRRYIYYPAQPKAEMRRSLLNHLIDTFFGGSVSEAALTLLSNEENLSPELLKQLEERIDDTQAENHSSPSSSDRDD